MISRLLRPPRLRTVEEVGELRHTTWMEAFYDLVFVVAVAALGKRLYQDASPAGILQFAGLFVPVWWAWVGHTIYAARFDTDDLVHRLATAAMMLAAAAMAVQIPTALGNGSAGFAAAYVGARAILILLYLGARYTVPEARGVASLYITGFGLGAGLWAASIFVPSPTRYALWVVGLAVDFATPWVGRWRGILRRFPLGTSHLPERFGLFTIIVLGETILGVVGGMAQVRWQAASVATAALAFAIAVCIWWIYFTFVDEAPFICNLGSGQPYIYGHLPIVVAVVVIGVGMRHAIAEAAQPTLDAETLRLVDLGVVLWLVAYLVLMLANVRNLPLRRTVGTYAGTVGVSVLITGLGAYVSPPLVLAGLTLMFVALAQLDVYSWGSGQHGGVPSRQRDGATQEYDGKGKD
jgi:low temperature requirement protein LtrA